MHYFKRNIGDYHKKAGRLTMLEHGAYTLLIDSCYDRERFPTKSDAIDWCWARTPEEIYAVEFVLQKFFTLDGELYVQKRISDEIAAYHENAKKNKEIAINREKKRKGISHEPCEIMHEPCTDGHLTINQEPRTINHKPKETKKAAAPQLRKNAADEEFEKLLDGVIDLWNTKIDFAPPVKQKTKTRIAAVKKICDSIEKMNLLENWERFFDHICESDFLTGRNGKSKTVFSFDWVIDENNFAKIIEGNYDNE